MDKAQSLIEQILPTVTSFVQDVSNFVVVALIYLIALFLVSLDLPNIKSKFYHVFKEETGQKIRYVFSQIGRVFTGFFKAQFLLSLVVFALSYIWLKLAGSPHALIMSVLIWLIDLIPVIGSIVVLAPWALYTFIVGDTAFGIQLLLLAATIIVFRTGVGAQSDGTPHRTVSVGDVDVALFRFVCVWGRWLDCRPAHCHCHPGRRGS